MPKMNKVGDAIKEKFETYKEIYDSLKADPKFSERAKSLATHDLYLQKYVAERALEKLEAYIEKNPV